MSKYKKLSHVVYKCDYHIVWVPKYRFRILNGEIKKLVEEDIRMLCEWKKCEVQEMSVQNDHIHLVVSIPPKVSVSQMMGRFIRKGGGKMKRHSRVFLVISMFALVAVVASCNPLDGGSEPSTARPPAQTL